MSLDENLKLLKALSEETRYKIVEVLLEGEKCACEIPVLIERTQSNTSMHLAKLTDLGILQSRREGKQVIYSIKDKRTYDLFKLLGHKKPKTNKISYCANKKKK